MDLLMEMNAKADLTDGRSFTVNGLMIVDEKKLLALPDARALSLFRSGRAALDLHAPGQPVEHAAPGGPPGRAQGPDGIPVDAKRSIRPPQRSHRNQEDLSCRKTPSWP
jgi:hypothetical protein